VGDVTPVPDQRRPAFDRARLREILLILAEAARLLAQQRELLSAGTPHSRCTKPIGARIEGIGRIRATGWTAQPS